ncbi:uncharacterized protein V6R79_001925 [Siganus canaliculatus]
MGHEFALERHWMSNLTESYTLQIVFKSLNSTMKLSKYCKYHECTTGYFTFYGVKRAFRLNITVVSDVMPQHGLSYDGRRRTFRSTCKASDLATGAALVNGGVHNGFPGVAATSNEWTQNGTKAPNIVKCSTINGYINHAYKGQKSLPPRKPRKQEGPVSYGTKASVADQVNTEAIQCNGIANRTSLGNVALPCHVDQMTSEPSMPAGTKNRSKWRNHRHKKRLPKLPPHEEEDWENELQEVTMSDWDKMVFGVSPYGPEDLLHWAFRDLTLKQTDTVPPPVTARYRPSVHHRRPISWSCFRTRTEPDQFADADE